MALSRDIEREKGTASSFASLTNGWPWDVSEDTPELSWPLNVVVYDKMRRSDGQIIGTLAGISLPMRQARWELDPKQARDEVVQLLAEDLDLPVRGQERPPDTRSRRDRFSFAEHMRLAQLALPYGHMPFEQVYRIVDGKARLRKLAPRMPRTLSRIRVARDGGLEGITQYGDAAQRTKPEIDIDVDRLVFYCLDREAGAWQGRSILRGSYSPWLLKDRLKRVSTMYIERNGMGVPTIEAPSGVSPAQMDELQKIADSYRAGDRSGATLPFGASLRLRGVEGSIPDALPYIRYYDEQITKPVLEMFMELGSTLHGSRALGASFIDFFAMALDAFAGWFADTFTQHVIEDIVDLNWGPDEPSPALAPPVVDSDQDIPPESLVKLVQAHAITLDDELEAFLRERYKLPARGAGPAREPGQIAPSFAGRRRPIQAASLRQGLADALSELVHLDDIMSVFNNGGSPEQAARLGIASDLGAVQDQLEALYQRRYADGVRAAEDKLQGLVAAGRSFQRQGLVSASLADIVSRVAEVAAGLVDSIRQRVVSALQAGRSADEVAAAAVSDAIVERIEATEAHRARTAASLDVYESAGLQQLRWVRSSGSDVADECADNDGQVADLGEWATVSNVPPLHPNCECELDPV